MQTYQIFISLPYLRGKESERQTAQRWGHFDVGPVRIPDVTKVTITSVRLWQTATGLMVNLHLLSCHVISGTYLRLFAHS